MEIGHIVTLVLDWEHMPIVVSDCIIGVYYGNASFILYMLYIKYTYSIGIQASHRYKSR